MLCRRVPRWLPQRRPQLLLQPSLEQRLGTRGHGANGRPWAGSQSLRVALPGGETDDPPPTIFRLKFVHEPFCERPCITAQDRVLFPNRREIPRCEPRHEGIRRFSSEEASLLSG